MPRFLLLCLDCTLAYFLGLFSLSLFLSLFNISGWQSIKEKNEKASTMKDDDDLPVAVK